MAKSDILVSVLAVLRDQGHILPAFLEETAALLDSHYANYEILLLDNGSSDKTVQIVKPLLGQYRCIRYIRLTRSTDPETALMAGLDVAIGDYVVNIHPDYDPPAEIIPMIESCRSGNDLVIGVDRHPSRPGVLYRFIRSIFLVLIRRMLHLELRTNRTELRVLSRQAVNALVKVRLRRRYFAIVAADIGLTTAVHSYERISRSGNQPVYRIGTSARIGLSVLVHNSIVPLRVASALGLVGSFLSFAYSLYVIAVYLFKKDVMPGWTTLSLVLSGLFALVFLILSLMGEYMGRLLEETTDRPLYHIRDEQSSAVMLSDLTRRNVLSQTHSSDPLPPDGVQ
jgi:dolichol-phosphate mannosyltransferase